MALQKTVQVAGYGITANYFRIDRVDYIDDQARDARFVMKVYVSQQVAEATDARGFPAGFVRFPGAAFDQYFSKEALAASGKNIYAQTYQAIKDLTAAIKLAAAVKAAPSPDQAPAITDAQKLLAVYGMVQSDFGDLAYDGAADV